MRIVDRIFEYLKHHNLTPSNFERTCGMSNGYLKKQIKGKGSIGSDIIEKIVSKYSDISLIWLLTGKGKMLNDTYSKPDLQVKEDANSYSSQEHTISILREKVAFLEKSLADKEKIIRLLEAQTPS